MKEPPIPENESARQAALDRLEILDTEAEDRFDRVVRLAASLFDVPIALLSLIDRQRQWFKARVGLDVSETPRAASFCAYAIQNEEPLVVRDSLEDERFADNPLVLAEPHIRFYAGHPIKAPDGSSVGTLCLIDRQPRDFSARDAERLRDLAAILEAELQLSLSRTRSEVRPNSAEPGALLQMEAMIEASDAAVLCLDSNLRLKRFTPRCTEFFKLDSTCLNRSIAEIESYLEFPTMLQDIEAVIQQGRSREKLVNSLNSRKLLARLNPFREPASAQRCVALALTDVTNEEIAQNLENIFDGLSARIAALDRTGRIIYTNKSWDQFARENGDPLLLKTSVGTNYLAVCYASGGEAIGVADAFKELLTGHRLSYTSTYECSSHGIERIFMMNAVPVHYHGSGIVVSHTDVTQCYKQPDGWQTS